MFTIAPIAVGLYFCHDDPATQKVWEHYENSVKMLYAPVLAIGFCTQIKYHFHVRLARLNSSMYYIY